MISSIFWQLLFILHATDFPYASLFHAFLPCSLLTSLVLFHSFSLLSPHVLSDNLALPPSLSYPPFLFLIKCPVTYPRYCHSSLPFPLSFPLFSFLLHHYHPHYLVNTQHLPIITISTGTDIVMMSSTVISTAGRKEMC